MDMICELGPKAATGKTIVQEVDYNALIVKAVAAARKLWGLPYQPGALGESED